MLVVCQRSSPCSPFHAVWQVNKTKNVIGMIIESLLNRRVNHFQMCDDDDVDDEVIYQLLCSKPPVDVWKTDVS